MSESPNPLLRPAVGAEARRSGDDDDSDDGGGGRSGGLTITGNDFTVFREISLLTHPTLLPVDFTRFILEHIHLWLLVPLNPQS